MANGIARMIQGMPQFQPVSSLIGGMQAGQAINQGALQNRLAQAQLSQATNGLAGNALSPEVQGLVGQYFNPETRDQVLPQIAAQNPKLASELQGIVGAQQKRIGESRTREQKVLASLLPRVETPEQLEQALSVAKRMGVGDASLTNIRDMWSPETKDLVLAAYGAGGGAGLDKDRFSVEDKLRSQYLAQAKDFKSLGSAYRKIAASAQNPSPAGDVSLIYGYMKMLDPGSTVMEGEQASARNAAGVPDRIRAMYNSVVGGGSLAPAQRADFLNRATDLYQSQATLHDKLTNQYSQIAQRVGVDPRNVILDVGVPVEGRVEAQPQAATQAPQQPRAQQQAARPMSQADYDALPSGALFVDPDDGKTYRKP